MGEEEVPVKRKNIVANIVLKDKAKEPGGRKRVWRHRRKLLRKPIPKKSRRVLEELSDLEIIANILKKEYGEISSLCVWKSEARL